MLKIRGIFTALLLTLSLNAFAVCFHNQTSKSIYIHTVSDETFYDPKKIKPGDKYCTTADEEAEKEFVWTVTKTKSVIITPLLELEKAVICGAELRNITFNDIYVVQDGKSKSCIGL